MYTMFTGKGPSSNTPQPAQRTLQQVVYLFPVFDGNEYLYDSAGFVILQARNPLLVRCRPPSLDSCNHYHLMNLLSHSASSFTAPLLP